MSDSFLKDEQKVSDDRQRDELLEPAALQEPLSDLSELQPVVSLTPQASVREAVKQMREKSVGIVLVVEEGKLVGVFSERDVLRKVVGEDVDLDSTQLSELMTENPECLHAENPLVYALHQMSVGGYRHIPLIDEQGSPVAVVSMRDIVGHLAALYPDQVMNLPGHPNQAITSTREGA
ncbi:MAG: CBS domain-containing protein [Planctomycetaceae bacterium]